MFLQFVVWYNATVGICKEIFMVTSFFGADGQACAVCTAARLLHRWAVCRTKIAGG
jgi:hypothetical protein